MNPIHIFTTNSCKFYNYEYHYYHHHHHHHLHTLSVYLLGNLHLFQTVVRLKLSQRQEIRPILKDLYGTFVIVLLL